MSQAAQDKLALKYQTQDLQLQDPQALQLTTTKGLQTELPPDVQYQVQQTQSHSQQNFEPHVLKGFQREDFHDHKMQVAQGLETQTPSRSQRLMSEEIIQPQTSQDVVSQDLRKQSQQSLLLQFLDLQTQDPQSRPIEAHGGLKTQISQDQVTQVPKARNIMPLIVQIALTPKCRRTAAHNRRPLKIYVQPSRKRDQPTQPPRGRRSLDAQKNEGQAPEDEKTNAAQEKPKPKENALKINDPEEPEGKQEGKPKDKQKDTTQDFKVNEAQGSDGKQVAPDDKQVVTPKSEPEQPVKINESQIREGEPAGAPKGKKTSVEKVKSEPALAAKSEPALAAKGEPALTAGTGELTQDIKAVMDQPPVGKQTEKPKGFFSKLFKRGKKDVKPQENEDQAPAEKQTEAPVAKQTEASVGKQIVASVGKPTEVPKGILSKVSISKNKLTLQESRVQVQPLEKQTEPPKEFLKFSNLKTSSTSYQESPPCTCDKSVKKAHQEHRNRLHEIYQTRSSVSRWAFSPEQRATLEKEAQELEFANINLKKRYYNQTASLDRGSRHRASLERNSRESKLEFANINQKKESNKQINVSNLSVRINTNEDKTVRINEDKPKKKRCTIQ